MLTYFNVCYKQKYVSCVILCSYLKEIEKETIIEHTGYKLFCDKTRTKHDVVQEKDGFHC